MTLAPVIAGRGLEKSYGQVQAVRGIDFEVAPGRCVGLLGPNGAGKTTTMRMIMGLTRPSGRRAARCSACRSARSAAQQKARIGLVPQDNNLDPDLSVRQNLEVYGRYFGLPRRLIAERIPALLAFMQLGDKVESRGQPAVRRHEAPPGDRPRPDQRSGARDPRRADHRPRPAGPGDDLEAAARPQARRARRCC